MNTFSTGVIDGKILADFQKQYDEKPNSKLLTNALRKVGINDLAMNADAFSKQQFLFSTDIETMSSTNQFSSGRCWLFAATNCLREIVAKKLNLANFELSQSWLAFWDKFERCNFYLESVLATAKLDIDDRTVSFIIKNGVSDGGQWDMFVNIVRKYGLCPKTAYDETAQSGMTRFLNMILNANLKRNACVLRNMAAGNASETEIRTAKKEMMAAIYVFLTTCYGRPPEHFDFEYRDKDKQYFRKANYTPKSFKDEFFGDMLDDYISIINAPTADKPFNRTFTVDFLGNVAEASPIRYFNLEMKDFKQCVLNQLHDGEITWFGSDCGKYAETGEKRTKNLFDSDLYDYKSVTGLELDMTKAEMLDYGYSAMNHAMVITGVNEVDGVPNRWKIQNSWGNADPNQGYYFMSDKWFEQYVFQAVVHKKYLGEKAGLLELNPIVLKPWDPMGTLAD